MIITKEILESLGYSNIIENQKEFRLSPTYRESDNNTSLRILKENGRWIDFSANLSGNFYDFVKLSLNLSSFKDCQKWIESKNLSFEILDKKETVLSYTEKKFNTVFLQDYSYWNKRKISNSILSQFLGGICDDKRMQGRYTFPIFNSKKDIIGLAGRDIYNNSNRPKWKLLGNKINWVYPAFINRKEIFDKKSVILVEGISDCLSLFESGLTNVICLFGVKLNKSILNFLLKCNIKKIIISTNNDLINNNNSVGNQAAEQIKKSLMGYFDESVISINIPKDYNDWGDALMAEDSQYIISQF